jgi:hypothetical protein
MKLFFLILAATMLLFACTSRKKPQNKFDQLVGLWQTNNSETDLYESWERANDSTLNGKSYVINGTDSIFFETVALRTEGNNTYYIPTVPNQNEGKAVAFRMVRSTDTSFVFENTLHDFPQRITYRFASRDSLYARVEGMANGELRMEEFFYHRIK